MGEYLSTTFIFVTSVKISSFVHTFYNLSYAPRGTFKYILEHHKEGKFLKEILY